MENFEKLFNQFLDCVQTLQNALNVSFTEALVETFDNLEQGKIKVENGAPDEKTVEELSKKYQALDYENISQKDKAQVFTFLTLKAINDDGLDANHMPTPPAISTVIAMLMHKLLKDEKMEIVDPAVGTGILLFSIISQLKALNHSKDNYQLVGIDNDEEMLNLTDVAAHLNDVDIELYCQDALMPWMCPNADAIVSDLPIGYYPIDENAKNFENQAKKGHSFAHLLLIEQIIKNLKPDGYAFLVVPKSILSGKIGADFMPWLTKKVYLKAIVELPDDMFRNKFNQRSILVFQNHGSKAKPSEVLLTKLDSLKKEQSLVQFNVKLNEWYTKINH
ncbi:class I SAM-dependent methyltransferase [uncultured Lactobacillus sp.]|mgnify:FL=1|uniref:class I SAM-dependent methyltransferase n=1 Tax=uncultured Lactobacillus sp. TaxID=153152 RepID=UPI002803F4D9|nr:class I SAM-dependent methyltransferase [uncultured Lactobacillus sp.]